MCAATQTQPGVKLCSVGADSQLNRLVQETCVLLKKVRKSVKKIEVTYVAL